MMARPVASPTGAFGMAFGMVFVVAFVASSSALASPPSPAAMARAHGYHAEEHTARTDDGHLLGVFRIRRPDVQHDVQPQADERDPVKDPVKDPVNDPVNDPVKDPVLLVPGLACNAAIWVLLGPGKALAYLLADRGYDVWLADHRGGMFSRRHVNLTDRDAAFWNYSLDDVGRLDVPALLRLVTQVSGRTTVSYVGHSMGASVLSVMASATSAHDGQDTRALVSRAYLLAPAAYMGHASQPAVYGSAGAITRLHDVVGLFSSGEIPLNSWWMRMTIQGVCSNASPFCVLLGGVYVGHDSDQINKTALPFYFEYFPDSISVKNVQHFTQHFGKERDFRRFDYGLVGNMAAYDTDQPPEYDLNKSTFPASIYYGDNDFLVNRQDVIEFSEKLPNLVRPPSRIALDKFSHADFFLANDAKQLLYDQIIRNLEEDEARTRRRS